MQTDQIDFPMEFAQGMIGSVYQWGRDVREGWYACEFPERPTDPLVMWHYETPCRACQIAVLALLSRHPEDSHVLWIAGKLLGSESIDKDLLGDK